MILLIDNYDSFVYNLARYVRELGEEPLVRRHDAMTVDDVLALAPSHVIISPGPCSPAEAGISTDVVRRVGPDDPDPRRLPGPPVHRRGLRRGDRARRAARCTARPPASTTGGSDLFTGLPSPFLAPATTRW